jgi:hypothetical protein
VYKPVEKEINLASFNYESKFLKSQKNTSILAVDE